MSEYVTIVVRIKAKKNYNVMLFKCSLKVSMLLQFIISLGRLFHKWIETGKKLYLYASTAVYGYINLKSLPLVFLVLRICYITR